MDTIRIYLENMFANFPKTDEVLRAKEELLSMMEDKYNELIADGKPDNEAVGVIISEFGNLDEIAQSLGLYKATEGEEDDVTEKVGRHVNIEEARDFIVEYGFSRFLLSIGIGLCIVSVVPPIFADELAKLFAITAVSKLTLAFAMIGLFVFVAMGVGLIVLSSARKKEWKFLKEEPCYIDDMTKEYVKGELSSNQITKGITLAMGIVLCSLSVMPAVVLPILFNNEFINEGLAPSLLFIMAGIGVFFIVNASGKTGACRRLLHLGEDVDCDDDDDDDVKEIKKTTVNKNNGSIKIEKHTKNGNSIVVSIDNSKKDDIMDNWEKETTKAVETISGEETVNNSQVEAGGQGSPLMETILENFWFVVFIIFMLGGFVFHMWGRIWLIWIIAPIVHTYLKKAYGRK